MLRESFFLLNDYSTIAFSLNVNFNCLIMNVESGLRYAITDSF